MLTEVESAFFSLCTEARAEIVGKTRFQRTDISIHLFTHCDHNNNSTFDWHISSGYSDEIKVKGKVLADCVEEFCRRAGWVAQQEALLLASVKVEDL